MFMNCRWVFQEEEDAMDSLQSISIFFLLGLPVNNRWLYNLSRFYLLKNLISQPLRIPLLLQNKSVIYMTLLLLKSLNNKLSSNRLRQLLTCKVLGCNMILQQQQPLFISLQNLRSKHNSKLGKVVKALCFVLLAHQEITELF